MNPWQAFIKVFALGVAVVISTSMASSNPLYESAVVHYEFETLGDGGEVADSGPNGVDLVALHGDVTLVTGVNGNGLRLPDDIVLTTTGTGSDDSILNVTRDTPFTIASWVKLENADDRFYLASKYRRDIGGPLELRGWSFGIYADGRLEAIWRLDHQLGTDGRIIVRSDDGITDTQWHHIAMTFSYDEADDTRGMRLYLDGELQSMTSSDTGLASNDDIDLSHEWPFVLNGRYDVQLNEGGSADDLAIWRTMLSPQDIASLAPPSSLPGDFDGNGMVDAADYTVWRDAAGGAYTSDDYNTWKANFGATTGAQQAGGAKAGPSASIPEPSSTILFAVCGFAVALQLRQRSRRAGAVAK